MLQVKIRYYGIMNTTPTAKVTLCYGDSNTWGQTPDKTGHRFPADIRWTGVLQASLGDAYYVIEEGLSSRTTELEYAKKPGRNGRIYLEPCLDSHAPIDTIILMLGTNDLKIEFNRTAEEIAQALRGLVELIQAKTAKYNGTSAKIILVSPILIDGDAPRHKEWYSSNYNKISAEKSKELAEHLALVAQATGCRFIDAAQIAHAGEDGIHFDEASHGAFGKLLAEAIRSEN